LIKPIPTPPPQIVALGFNLYKQRRLLQKNFLPILTGAGACAAPQRRRLSVDGCSK
jgi:hypothetical protein